MIVLGPHVLTHLGGAPGGGKCLDDASVASLRDAPVDDAADDVAADVAVVGKRAATAMVERSLRRRRRRRTLHRRRTLLDETRLAVSSSLGSTGAPPLLSDGGGVDCDLYDCDSYDDDCIDDGDCDLYDDDRGGDPSGASDGGDGGSMTTARRDDGESNDGDDASSSSSFESYLAVVSDLSDAHAELALTAWHALEVIRRAAGARLGLDDGSGYAASFPVAMPVARAEDAWIGRTGVTRRTRRGAVASLPPPHLAVRRSRGSLVRSLADQSSSLRGLLRTFPRASGGEGEEDGGGEGEDGWDAFVDDLRCYSSSSPSLARTLTVSRLSSLVDGVCRLLSRVLSAALSPPAIMPLRLRFAPVAAEEDGGFVVATTMMMMVDSERSARERTEYLRAAFGLERRPHGCDTDDDSGDDTDTYVEVNTDGAVDVTQNKKRGNFGRDIEEEEGGRATVAVAERRDARRLRSLLDAASVRLWAFESSDYRRCSASSSARSEKNDKRNGGNDDEDGEGDGRSFWWTEIRRAVRRTEAALSKFEGRHDPLRSRDGDEATTAGKKIDTDGRRDTCDVANESTVVEFVSRGGGDGGGGFSASAKAEERRTAVFSGSGTRGPAASSGKASSPKSGGRGGSRFAPKPPPLREPDATDRTSLLDDLRNRLRSMGLDGGSGDNTAAEEEERGAASFFAPPSGGGGGERPEATTTSGGASSTRRKGESSSSHHCGRTKSDPFFLGVSGSALAELSSAFASASAATDAVSSDG